MSNPAATVPRTLPSFFEKIFAKSPMQKKMITQFLKTADTLYWQRLEEFSERFQRFLDHQKVPMDYVVDAYLKMCRDMLSEQIYFKKTGEYTSKTAAEANARIYSSNVEMTSYMYGLAISQFLWPNHYGQFAFFAEQSAKLTHVSSYLEVGPGHGLFLLESLKRFSKADFLAVDISPISIGISKSLVKFFEPSSRCEFVLQDVNDLKGGRFDYIVMCELLEHLDCPSDILHKVYSLLKPGGHCFITTCANAPAIDHVYLYHNVAHMQKELTDARFKITAEIALPVGNFPRERWDAEKVEINYAAMLQKPVDANE